MIEVLGGEGCCDGETTWYVSRKNKFKPVTIETLDELALPEQEEDPYENFYTSISYRSVETNQ